MLSIIILKLFLIVFQQSCPKVAMQALESLVEHSPHHQQALTALRCLTRLRLTDQNQQEDNRCSGT